jgi:hypothetical protein
MIPLYYDNHRHCHPHHHHRLLIHIIARNLHRHILLPRRIHRRVQTIIPIKISTPTTLIALIMMATTTTTTMMTTIGLINIVGGVKYDRIMNGLQTIAVKEVYSHFNHVIRSKMFVVFLIKKGGYIILSSTTSNSNSNSSSNSIIKYQPNLTVLVLMLPLLVGTTSTTGHMISARRPSNIIICFQNNNDR